MQTKRNPRLKRTRQPTRREPPAEAKKHRPLVTKLSPLPPYTRHRSVQTASKKTPHTSQLSGPSLAPQAPRHPSTSEAALNETKQHAAKRHANPSSLVAKEYPRGPPTTQLLPKHPLNRTRRHGCPLLLREDTLPYTPPAKEARRQMAEHKMRHALAQLAKRLRSIRRIRRPARPRQRQRAVKHALCSPTEHPKHENRVAPHTVPLPPASVHLSMAGDGYRVREEAPRSRRRHA